MLGPSPELRIDWRPRQARQTGRARQACACALPAQAGTYNVNGRLPPPALDLRPWLDAGAGADIVAVAFQECVPLSASNVVMGAHPRPG